MPAGTSPTVEFRPAEVGAGRLVWLVAAVGVASIAGVFWWTFQSDPQPVSALGAVARIAYALGVVAFVLSGATIVSRQPRNVIGWLLMLPGLPLGDLLGLWLADLESVPTQADLGLWLAMWFTGWSWMLYIFPILHLLLTFPTGRFLTRRWRWAGWLETVMIAALLVLSALGEELQLVQGETVLWEVPNPIGFVPSSVFDAVFGVVWNGALLLLAVTCVAAVVVRFRRASSVERQQLKWLLGATALFGTVFGAGSIASGFLAGGVGDLVFALSIGAVPVAVAVAVLRYRLYEIDRIVSRTVTYGLVIGVLAAIFYGMVGILASVLPTGSDLAVAASTLLVAAAFNPLRRRVRDVVDRRFNRARFDAGRVLDRFSDALRGRTGADDVIGVWMSAVSDTMQPSAVSLWLKPAAPPAPTAARTIPDAGR